MIYSHWLRTDIKDILSELRKLSVFCEKENIELKIVEINYQQGMELISKLNVDTFKSPTGRFIFKIIPKKNRPVGDFLFI